MVDLLLDEQFTGSSGAAWPSPWTKVTLEGVAQTADQNGAGSGRITANSSGTFSYTLMHLDDVGLVTSDARVVFPFNLHNTPTTSRFAFAALRYNSSTHARYQLGYLDFNGGTNLYIRYFSDATTVVWTEQISPNNWENVDYNLRAEAEGTTLRLKVWKTSVSEPGTWDIEKTGATELTSGRSGVISGNGASRVLTIRDFQLYNLAATVSLVIDDAGHGHTADNVALTQAHTLAVDDATHEHTAGNVALSGDQTVESSDTGSGDDSQLQIDRDEDSESAIGVDAETADVAVAESDTGSGAEADEAAEEESLSRTVDEADSGVGVDAESVAPGVPFGANVVFLFEAAFGVNPGTVPDGHEWVDLSARLGDPDGVEWGYGRQTELDRMEAGVGSVTLDNTDRALDPENEASIYWPNIRPMTRVRLKARHLGVVYPVFEGFVEGWKPTWQHPGVGWVTVPIVDGTKLLAQARTSVAYSAEASGSRVGSLLDAADWPAAMRDLDVGQSGVQAYDASDRIVLNALRDTAAAEDGVFFVASDGVATFYDRYSRIVAESQATFGDADGELPYQDLALNYDDTLIFNDVAVKPDEMSVQRATDQGSIDAFGRRWLDMQDVLITSELEASDSAHWRLRRYKDPRLRVEALTVDWVDGDAVVTQMLSREIGDRIIVKRRPPGGGDPIVVEAFIEHVSHRISGLSWTTTWKLSPAFTETVWRVGIVGSTELDATAALGY